MCKRVIERYSVCKCDYYIHDVDICPEAYSPGHLVEDKVALVGYCCSNHIPPPQNLNTRQSTTPGFGMNAPRRTGSWEDAFGTTIPKLIHQFRPQIKSSESGGRTPKKGGISMQVNWQWGPNSRQEDYQKTSRPEKQNPRGLLSKELKPAEESEPIKSNEEEDVIKMSCGLGKRVNIEYKHLVTEDLESDTVKEYEDTKSSADLLKSSVLEKISLPSLNPSGYVAWVRKKLRGTQSDEIKPKGDSCNCPKEPSPDFENACCPSRVAIHAKDGLCEPNIRKTCPVHGRRGYICHEECRGLGFCPYPPDVKKYLRTAQRDISVEDREKEVLKNEKSQPPSDNKPVLETSDGLNSSTGGTTDQFEDAPLSQSEKNTYVKGATISRLHEMAALGTLETLQLLFDKSPPRPKYEPKIAKKPSKEDDGIQKEMFIHLQQYLENAPSSKSNFSLSREALAKKYHKFRQKATEAFRKLELASLYRSEDFDRFVFQDLQTVDNVIDIGQSALCEFIDGKMKKPPNNLISLYCVLHICYAMSRASDSNAPRVTDSQFAKSAAEWKHCITADTDPKLRRQKQELFDELVEVMWDEFKEGFEYAMRFENAPNTHIDSMFETAAVFDTNDPGFLGWNPPDVNLNWDEFVNMGDLSSESAFEDMSFTPFESVSGTSHTITPAESGPSPSPSWEALASNTFITAALNFIEELKETGIVFLYLCGSIAVSTLRHFTNTRTPSTPEPPKPGLDERQDIINSLTPNTANNITPIVKAVSKPFLTGVIDTFNDLEECMVAFLKVTSNDPHSFLCSFIHLTIHFYDYYHKHLPQHLKCTSDGYNSPTYVSERIRAEENSLIPKGDNKIAVNDNKTLANKNTTPTSSISDKQRNCVIPAEIPAAAPRARKRKSRCDEEDGLVMKACMKKFRCEGGFKPVKPRTEFVFKVMTGDPAKRKSKRQ